MPPGRFSKYGTSVDGPNPSRFAKYGGATVAPAAADSTRRPRSSTPATSPKEDDRKARKAEIERLRTEIMAAGKGRVSGPSGGGELRGRTLPLRYQLTDPLESGARGLAESGYATAIGLNELLGQDEEADYLRRKRGEMQEFYGPSLTGAGKLAHGGARMAGDLAQFMAPGTAATRFAKYARAGAEAAAQAGKFKKGEALVDVARVLEPTTRVGEAAKDFMLAAPLTAAFAQAGVDESTVGSVAPLIAGAVGGDAEKTRAFLEEHPTLRTVADLAVDALLSRGAAQLIPAEELARRGALHDAGAERMGYRSVERGVLQPEKGAVEPFQRGDAPRLAYDYQAEPPRPEPIQRAILDVLRGEQGYVDSPFPRRPVATAEESAAAWADPPKAEPKYEGGAEVEIDFDEINVDPARFQFKSGGDAGGVTKKSAITGEKFDRVNGSPFRVWQDPADGKTYLVDGHHRYGTFKDELKGSKVRARYIEAESAEEARMLGAQRNIDRGRATEQDAAKIAGELEQPKAARAVTIAGNQRHMMEARLQRDLPEKWAAHVEAMEKKAPEFGLGARPSEGAVIRRVLLGEDGEPLVDVLGLGREQQTFFPGTGEKVRTAYAWVELDRATASHDPFSFERVSEEAFPSVAQGRAYHGNRGKAARETVIAQTQKFDPDLFLDATSSADGGVPIIGPRSMDTDRMRELNAASDAPKGKVKDAVSDASTRAELLRGSRSLEHFAQTLAPDQTVRAYLETKAGRDFVRELISDGVITQAERARYLDAATGNVTAEGKQLLERLMHAAAVGDPDVLARATASSIKKIEQAAPALVRASMIDGYDLRPTLRSALDLIASARATDQTLADYIRTADMFAAPPSERAVRLAEFIDSTGQRGVADTFRRYAEGAADAARANEAEDIFGYVPPNSDELFDRVFGPAEESVAVAALRVQRPNRFARHGLVVPAREPEVIEDLFGGRTTTGPEQGALFEDRAAVGVSQAELEARQTVSFLEGKVKAGTATQGQRAAYHRAVSFLRRNEKLSPEEALEGSLEARIRTRARDRDSGDLFGLTPPQAIHNPPAAVSSVALTDIPDAELRAELKFVGRARKAGRLHPHLTQQEVAAARHDPSPVPALERYEDAQIKAARRKLPTLPQTEHRARALAEGRPEPERAALYDRIFAKLYGVGARKKERKAAIIMGGPASGKSSYARARGWGDYLEIDSDAVKAELPEFMDGLNANGVHEESAELASRMQLHAMEQGDNIILPIVGKTPEGVRKLLNLLEQYGYTVDLSLVELPVRKALARVVARFHHEGRFVAPEYVWGVGDKPARTFALLKTHGAVRSFERVSSDTPRGMPYVIIESDLNPGYIREHGGETHALKLDASRGAAGRAGDGSGRGHPPSARAGGEAGAGEGSEAAVPGHAGSPLDRGYQHPLPSETLPDVTRRRLVPSASSSAPRRSKIISELSDALGVPIKTGRFRLPGAVAVYNSRQNVIRTRTANDIEAVAHETGHALHSLLFGVSSRGHLQSKVLKSRPWKDEILTLAKEINQEGSLFEGWAEFWRRYLTNMDAAQRKAPKLFAWAEGQLDGPHRDAGTALRKFRDEYELYKKASPQARIRAHISTQEDPVHLSVRDRWHRFRLNVIDDANPVERMVKGITKERPDLQTVAEEIPRLMRLASGADGAAEHFIERGVIDFNTLEATTKGLDEILSPLGERIDDFRDYAVAMRATELWSRGIETGLDIQDVTSTIARLGQDEQLVRAFDELQEYNRGLLKYLHDAGVLSEDTYKEILENNRSYVPFYRVMDEQRKGGRGAGTFGHLFNPVHKIKGSGREIIDPLESIIKNTHLYTQLAARQQASQALAQLADQLQTGKWIREIDAPLAPQSFNVGEIRKQLGSLLGDQDAIDRVLTKGMDEELLMVFRPGDYFGQPNVISVVKDGKRRWYEVPEEVYAALTGLEKEQVGAFVRLLAFPARTLRAGATLALEFMARNPFRDQIMSFVQSEYGYKPGFDFARGLMHMLKKDDLYWKWKAAGGSRAAFIDIDRSSLQRSLNKMIRTKQGVPNVVKNPLDILRALSAAGEDATRLGEFLRGVAVEGTEKEGLQLAAAASREVNLDYSRHGAKTAALRQIAAFWGARVQGYDKLYRTFRAHPERTLARSFAAITVPTILLHYANRDDPKYWEIPQWQRDLFWIVNVNGHYIRLPKPFELGLIFGTIPERMLEWMDTQDPEGVKVALRNTFLRELTSTVLPIPTFAAPIIENFANRSLFSGRSLVPQQLEKVKDSEQYTAGTSEVAKQIGRWLDMSPAKLDAFLFDWTGGLGRTVSMGVDAAVELARPGEMPRMKPSELPGVKGFTVREPGAQSESVERFYRMLGKAREAKATVDLYEREGRWDDLDEYSFENEEELAAVKHLEGVADQLAKIRAEMRLIERDPDMSGAEKRAEIDARGVEMMELARDAIERRYYQPKPRG